MKSCSDLASIWKLQELLGIDLPMKRDPLRLPELWRAQLRY